MPQVTELQQQSHISSAFCHPKHPLMPTASTDPVFPRELQWECESVYSFYDSTHPSSYIETGSKGPALATAGSFKEQHRGALKPFIFLPHWETIESLPHSLPGYLDKYLTDNLFSLSFLLASPIFSLFNFQRINLRLGQEFLE